MRLCIRSWTKGRIFIIFWSILIPKHAPVHQIMIQGSICSWCFGRFWYQSMHRWDIVNVHTYPTSVAIWLFKTARRATTRRAGHHHERVPVLPGVVSPATVRKEVLGATKSHQLWWDLFAPRTSDKISRSLRQNGDGIWYDFSANERWAPRSFSPPDRAAAPRP
jgi:hypothetical protein